MLTVPPTRHRSLPLGRNMEGHTVWESPVFNYSHYSGDEWEKKREAVMRYTENDPAKTTRIMDAWDQVNLHVLYHIWIRDNIDAARASEDRAREKWFWDLA